jgi:hypothetical protein
VPADPLRWFRLPEGIALSDDQRALVEGLDALLLRLQPAYVEPRGVLAETGADGTLRLSIEHQGREGGRLEVLLGADGYASLHWPGGEELDRDRLLATAEALLTGRNRALVSIVRGQITKSVTTCWDEDGTTWKTTLRVRHTLFPPIQRSRSTVSFERPTLLGPAVPKP